MTGRQEQILQELIEKYFSGGNASNEASGGTLKHKLDAIRDFVQENFSA